MDKDSAAQEKPFSKYMLSERLEGGADVIGCTISETKTSHRAASELIQGLKKIGIEPKILFENNKPIGFEISGQEAIEKYKAQGGTIARPFSCKEFQGADVELHFSKKKNENKWAIPIASRQHYKMFAQALDKAGLSYYEEDNMLYMDNSIAVTVIRCSRNYSVPSSEHDWEQRRWEDAWKNGDSLRPYPLIPTKGYDISRREFLGELTGKAAVVSVVSALAGGSLGALVGMPLGIGYGVVHDPNHRKSKEEIKGEAEQRFAHSKHAPNSDIEKEMEKLLTEADSLKGIDETEKNIRRGIEAGAVTGTALAFAGFSTLTAPMVKSDWKDMVRTRSEIPDDISKMKPDGSKNAR